MENNYILFFGLILLSFNVFASYGFESLEDKLRDDSDLSEFHNKFDNNPEAKSTLAYKQLTLFAPTNRAFQNKSPKTNIENNDFINYHMSNQAITLNQLGAKVSTELTGNPPLWVTRRTSPTGRQDIYVNNAKITKGNFQYTNTNKRKQVLHLIDSVLEPLKPLADNNQFNPDAYELLTKSDQYDLESFRLTKFKKIVEDYNKGSTFQGDSRYTFFIPIDEGFKDPLNRAGAIDEKIIDGHIIPNHVLFTTPTPYDVQYETLAFGDMLKVTIAFKKETEGKNSNTLFIVSDTIVGDAKHRTGVVLAEIVKANIPVKNGVVHLISRPLMVVDTSVKAFLEESKGLLSSFYNSIMDAAPEFLSQIADSEVITLFAPSNAAMSKSSMQSVFANKTRAREILNLHLIKGKKITSEDVLKRGVVEVPSMDPRKKLYFNVAERKDNMTLTVEGGGVNATVIQPNIASTNGIIHIIDSVLGVPFTTVRGKLATDPHLTSTFKLGEELSFNDQLDDSKLRFTYFVPRDTAWKKLEIQYPSLYTKVFMNEFAPNVKQILERHLVVANRTFTMGDLKILANVSYTLPSVRDKLEIKVTEAEADKSFYIQWRNDMIHVYRPDVECINGIIHVIDSVFLTESDIQVNSANTMLNKITMVYTLFLVTMAYYFH